MVCNVICSMIWKLVAVFTFRFWFSSIVLK